jgi:hypothetical protein
MGGAGASWQCSSFGWEKSICICMRFRFYFGMHKSQVVEARQVTIYLYSVRYAFVCMESEREVFLFFAARRFSGDEFGDWYRCIDARQAGLLWGLKRPSTFAMPVFR